MNETDASKDNATQNEKEPGDSTSKIYRAVGDLTSCLVRLKKTYEEDPKAFDEYADIYARSCIGKLLTDSTKTWMINPDDINQKFLTTCKCSIQRLTIDDAASTNAPIDHAYALARYVAFMNLQEPEEYSD